MIFQHTRTWKRNMLAFTCSLVCATAGVAFADAASDARKSIQASYDAESAALGKQDVDAVFRSYAPDYVSVDKKGKKDTLEQTKSSAKAVMSAMKTLMVTQKVQTCALKSGQATVVVKRHIIGVMQIEAKPAQKLLGDETAEELWAKTGAGWLRKRSKTLSQTMTMNGVPMRE